MGQGRGDFTDGCKFVRLLKAIATDAGNVYAHYQLALTYEAMAKPAKAVEYYHKVLLLPIVDHQDHLFRRWSLERIAKLAA